MELRSGAMPEYRPSTPAAEGDSGAVQPSASAPLAVAPPAALRWRVSPALTMFKGLGAILFAGAAALFADDASRVVIALAAAGLFAAYALRDLLVPVRLAADADGVTVISGYAGRRRISWSQVERVRVERRRRLGTHSELLEIDTGDTLHLLSVYELGAPIAEVAAALERLRQAGKPGDVPDASDDAERTASREEN